jgi:hypothetical protein
MLKQTEANHSRPSNVKVKVRAALQPLPVLQWEGQLSILLLPASELKYQSQQIRNV